MRVWRFLAACAAVVMGVGVAAVASTTPAGADVALVDYSCDLPAAGGLGGGLIPDTQTIADLEVELVDSPDPVVQGQPVTYAVDLPVPDITAGLDLPPEYAPYGTLEINHVVLTLPIPAGLTVANTPNVAFAPNVPWLTVMKSGSNLLFRVESTVAGNSPTGRSPMRLDLDAATPVLQIQQSTGVWVSVTPLPAITLTGTATGAAGTSIDVKPPSLAVQVQYAKQVGFGGLLLNIAWNDSNVPCVPIDPTQTVTSTAIVASAPGLSVSKALAPGDDEVTVGETIDYTVTVTNSGNVPLTGVTLSDPNATCASVGTTLAVGANSQVACTHVAAVGDVGTYSNTASGDSTQTAAVASNTVNTAVGAVAAPALSVSKALASGDEAVLVGETIDYTVTLANTGNVALTGVTLSDPNATCEAVATSLAVGANSEVACTHVAAVVGTYSNTATGDSAETAAVTSNTVSTTVTDPAPVCLPPEFPDVQESHAFFNEICWMVDAGITDGYQDGTFKPGNPVTRQAMAAFLQRLSGEPTPGDCTQQFTDVSTAHPFFDEICWMVGQEITNGYLDGTFRPGANVSRAAMAAFLYRFEGPLTFSPPIAATFPDVGTAHPFFEEVEWMVDEGITGGFPDNTYRPASNVTRQSMAAFLFRLTHPA